MRGREKRARRATPAPDALESQEDWLARLRTEHAHLDLDRELRAWSAYCQKQGKRPQRPHFEAWLTNCGPAVELPGYSSTGQPAHVEPEPEAWKAYLKDRYEGETWAETAAVYHWPELPANWRAKIAREMARAS
jgi:hypothetical protein